MACRPAAVASIFALATTPEQVLDNVRAGSWQPSVADLAALDEITQQV